MKDTKQDTLAVYAVAELYKQVEKIDPGSVSEYTPIEFYEALSNKHPKFRIYRIEKGPNEGKLTLEIKIDDKWKLDERIHPVDCYNLQGDGKSIADAVRIIEVPLY